MAFVHSFVALAAAVQAPTASRPPWPSPPTVAQPASTKLISGFRAAQFGMTPSAVRRAIATDFPGLSIADRLQPAEGTRVLQLTVPNLDPGPGPAVVSYVFGATSRKLALVSVSWATKAEATPDDRQAIALAALRLTSFLRASPQPGTVIAPKVIRAGAVSLYGALDAHGAGVELIASGIPYASTSGPAAQPTGPASLRLLYMANPANPDVRPPPISPR